MAKYGLFVLCLLISSTLFAGPAQKADLASIDATRALPDRLRSVGVTSVTFAESAIGPVITLEGANGVHVAKFTITRVMRRTPISPTSRRAAT